MLAVPRGGGFMAEREPWRHEAESKCFVRGRCAKASASSAPGDQRSGRRRRFLPVSTLSEGRALGYDELRPPGAIPRPSADMPPRWPIAEPAGASRHATIP
jgi:hypothetical protein